MKTPTWKDETSFSRGESDRTPRTWAASIGGERVRVHRHIHYPGKWLLSCWFAENKELTAADAGTARYEALHTVMEFLTKATADCDALLSARTPGEGGR